MHKRHVIGVVGILVAVSASVTIYLIRNPIRRTGDEVIEIGARNPVQKVSLRELIRKPPQATVTPLVGNGENTSPIQASQPEPPIEPRTVIVHPEWKSGSARVEGAYAISKPEGYAFPRWSPLGLDIAFTRSSLRGLFVAGPNSSQEREISDDVLSVPDYEWSRDGMSLIVHDRDSRTIELLLTGEKYPKPEMPRKVYERDGQIYCENEDGEVFRVSGSQDRFSEPVLSPDEAFVVYRGRETGLYISSVDGQHMISVGEGDHPSWLPDSSGIVFDVPISDGATIVDGDLWFAAADGSERTNLTNTPGIIESHPAISPDGERIAFVAGGAVYVGKFVRPKRQP